MEMTHLTPEPRVDEEILLFYPLHPILTSSEIFFFISPQNCVISLENYLFTLCDVIMLATHTQPPLFISPYLNLT